MQACIPLKEQMDIPAQTQDMAKRQNRPIVFRQSAHAPTVANDRMRSLWHLTLSMYIAASLM
jgi:hypothetical protein